MPLPPEIIDHVLSYLRSDITTLRTSSSVFPEFVERYLYADITIDSTSASEYRDPDSIDNSYVFDETTQCENLMTLFSARPHITHYVRHLHLIVGIGPLLSWEISLMSTNFSNLESIAVSSYNDEWDKLDPLSRSGILNILAQPSIKEVSMVNITYFPLASLDNCDNLKKLVLLGKFSEDDTASPSPFPRLLSLHATNQSSPTRFISWAKSNTVQSLSLDFRISTAPMSLMSSILEAYGASLTTLELDLSAFMYDCPSHPPAYPVLPFLQYMTVPLPLPYGYSSQLIHCLRYVIGGLLLSLSENDPSRKLHLTIRLGFSSTTQLSCRPLWSSWIECLTVYSVVLYPIKLQVISDKLERRAEVWSALEKDLLLQKLTREGKITTRKEDNL